MTSLRATRRFRESIPAHRKAEVFAAMEAARDSFGFPHWHTGLGLRRIPPLMECRCGLDLRLIFQRDGDELVFHFCGTHDEVRRFLKNRD